MTLNGVFFVGTHLTHVAGQYVAPMDQTAHPYTGVSWFFGDNTPGASANYANPGANIQPPSSFDTGGFAAQVLVRVNCSSGTAVIVARKNSVRNQLIAGVDSVCPISSWAISSRERRRLSLMSCSGGRAPKSMDQKMK